MAKATENANRRTQARQAGDAAYRQRRAEIVAAAARVFRRKGFKAASISDIATEAGTDRAGLYYYFASKQEFFNEVVREAIGDNVQMVEAVQASGDDAPRKIEALIRGLMRSYATHYPYLFVYVQENMVHIDADTPWGREMYVLGKRFDEAVTAIVQQGLDEGSLMVGRPADARVLAYAIIGMCNWSHRWFDPQGKLSADAIGAMFAGLVLKGMS